ncbi:MAG: response regulator [Anaerolineales bacterium]|nr:response regulator [Anaerolineales bacterium]
MNTKPTERKTILLVEDNADDEALTVRALRQFEQTDVNVARDGAEALDYFFANEGPGIQASNLPDLVLLDLKLPKMNGLEVLRELRGNQSTNVLPVVILTSSDERNDIKEGYRLGANSYVRKPVDYDKYQRVVRELAQYWLSINERPN